MLFAELELAGQRQIVWQGGAEFAAYAPGVEILVAAKPHLIEERVGARRYRLHPEPGIGEIEAGPGGHLAERQVEAAEFEVVIAERGPGHIDGIVVLGLQIVAVEDRGGREDVDVRRLDEIVRQAQRDRTEGRDKRRRSGSDIGVRLP